MIFGMELYNIARVLFMSRSGLATLNNRIYFGMYCALLLAAVAYLLLSRFMRAAARRQCGCGMQYAARGLRLPLAHLPQRL